MLPFLLLTFQLPLFYEKIYKKTRVNFLLIVDIPSFSQKHRKRIPSGTASVCIAEVACSIAAADSFPVPPHIRNNRSKQNSSHDKPTMTAQFLDSIPLWVKRFYVRWYPYRIPSCMNGLFPGLKKCPPDTFLRKFCNFRRPLRVTFP